MHGYTPIRVHSKFFRRWVSSSKNLFLPNMKFKPVTMEKNQNTDIMEWYKEFLFTAAAVYYTKRGIK